MSENTKNYSLRKDAPEDFYDVGVVNANLDKIDTALKSIDTEARNKDGGNADTVDGYHASEFTKYRGFDSLDELAETQYEGLFYIGGSEEITGISLKSGRDMDIQPDNTDFLEIYTRIYSDKEGKMYAADVYSTEYDFWTRKSLKTFSFDGHPHSVSDIEDFPVSLPASGGNADTVGGKQASDFALKNHSHTDFSAWDSDSDSDTSWGVSISASGINFQWNDDINDSELHISENGLMGGSFLPAISNFGNISAQSFLGNGSNLTNVNADTISGIGIDGIQTKQTGISSYTDWNDIVEPGFHKLMERGTENSPDGGDWFFPIVFAYSSSGITQLAAAYRYDWIYMRHKKTLENGTIGWTEWRKINDGGNADTIAGKSINAIQTRDSGYCFYNQNKDWNDLTDTGYYGLMHSTSTALHNPVNGKFFYPMVFKYAADSLTQLAIPHSAGENKDFGEIYIRSKNSSNGWSGWKSVGGNGCIRTVSFTAPTGSNWYRIITNDGDICSGIFTISGGVSNYSSATVFSASQCYNGTVTGTAKLVKLSHAAFNSFITKIRLVKPSTDNYYIDIYASNSGTANLKVTFNGIGWKILDNITTANASAGFSYSEEITL